MDRLAEAETLLKAAQAENEHVREMLDRKRDFVSGETVFVALFPLIYGVLTFAYSTALWNPAGVHAAALRVPGAPESWGGTFIVLSVAIVASACLRKKWWLVVSCLCASFVYATFMLIVLMASAAFPRTLGQAAIYLIFSLLFLNRARLAWVT